MTNKLCSVKDCEKNYYARGYCNFHWQRDRTGIPLDAPVKKRHSDTCLVDGCTREYMAKGYCATHKARLDRGVSLDSPIRARGVAYTAADPNLLTEILKRTTRNGDCREWTGSLNEQGYGTCVVDGVRRLTHRVVTSLNGGTPLEELPPVHHKCANRKCINPDHLQETTHRENMAEMLERNYYLKRIAQLEAENAQLKERLEVMTHGSNATAVGAGG